MYSKSEKIKIMINEKTDTVTEDPFKSLLSRYQRSKVANLHLMVLIYCITNVIKQM